MNVFLLFSENFAGLRIYVNIIMEKYCNEICFAVFSHTTSTATTSDRKQHYQIQGRLCYLFLHAPTPLRLLQSTSNWTLLTFFRIPITIENHANALRVPFHHNLLMGRRRDLRVEWEGWWAGRQINANQIIDELMWETRTKDHHHKNQLMDGKCRCGCRKKSLTDSFFCDKIIWSTFFRLPDKGVLRYEPKFLSYFHYVDEIKCIKNLYISRLRSFLFSGDINLCREIPFPMGAHFTILHLIFHHKFYLTTHCH